jgi:hypothetical protein
MLPQKESLARPAQRVTYASWFLRAPPLPSAGQGLKFDSSYAYLAQSEGGQAGLSTSAE